MFVQPVGMTRTTKPAGMTRTVEGLVQVRLEEDVIDVWAVVNVPVWSNRAGFLPKETQVAMARVATDEEVKEIGEAVAQQQLDEEKKQQQTWENRLRLAE